MRSILAASSSGWNSLRTKASFRNDSPLTSAKTHGPSGRRCFLRSRNIAVTCGLDSVEFDSCSLWARATLTVNEAGEPILSNPKASRKRRVDIADAKMLPVRLRESKIRRHALQIVTHACRGLG